MGNRSPALLGLGFCFMDRYALQPQGEQGPQGPPSAQEMVGSLVFMLTS